MLNVRLAGDQLFGKLLFTSLSLVVSMVILFVLSFFPRSVLDEILNLIESVSEDFPSYSCIDIFGEDLPNAAVHMTNNLSIIEHKNGCTFVFPTLENWL